MEVGGEDNSVESPLLLKSTTFHKGEYVFDHSSRGIREAKGTNKKWDEWVEMGRFKKCNIPNHKAPEEENPSKKMTELKPKNPNVATSKKRKTMCKAGTIEGWAENELGKSVVGVPLTMVGNPGVKVGLKAQHGQRVSRHVEQGLRALSVAMKNMKGPMDKRLGPTLPPFKHGPKLWEPRVPYVGQVGAPVAKPSSLTNDVDLLDPDKSSDFMDHVLPPRTKEKLLAMPEIEFRKNYDSVVVNNLVYMVEMKRRYDALKASEIEVKEELTRCKATITSQAKDIDIATEVAVGIRKELDDANRKVKEMQAERVDVIKGASRAEVARAQAEVETSALRAGRLELLGRLSEAENEVAVLKAENVELLKKLAEAEPTKKHA